MHLPDKKALRARLRQRRRQLPADAATVAGIAAASFAPQLPGWDEARRIAIYLAADGEVETAAIRTLCLALGKAVFLPVLTAGKRLEFARWQADSTLHPNSIGILEPTADAPRCPVAELDIVFLPLVGWDRYGARLGMGGGYYDYSLAGFDQPLRVGIAFGIQEVEELPTQDWDIGLDFVITERELHRAAAREVAGQPQRR